MPESKDSAMRGTPLWARRHPFAVACGCLVVGATMIVVGLLTGGHSRVDARIVATGGSAIGMSCFYFYFWHKYGSGDGPPAAGDD